MTSTKSNQKRIEFVTRPGNSKDIAAAKSPRLGGVQRQDSAPVAGVASKESDTKDANSKKAVNTSELTSPERVRVVVNMLPSPQKTRVPSTTATVSVTSCGGPPEGDLQTAHPETLSSSGGTSDTNTPATETPSPQVPIKNEASDKGKKEEGGEKDGKLDLSPTVQNFEAIDKLLSETDANLAEMSQRDTAGLVNNSILLC